MPNPVCLEDLDDNETPRRAIPGRGLDILSAWSDWIVQCYYISRNRKISRLTRS